VAVSPCAAPWYLPWAALSRCACAGLKALPTDRCPKTPRAGDATLASPHARPSQPHRISCPRHADSRSMPRRLAAVPTVSVRSRRRLRSVRVIIDFFKVFWIIFQWRNETWDEVISLTFQNYFSMKKCDMGWGDVTCSEFLELFFNRERWCDVK
jgi:hypothetical protein